VEKTGPVSYRVDVFNQIWRRHADQLLESPTVTKPNIVVPEMLEADIPVSAPSTEVTHEPQVAQEDSSTSEDRPSEQEMVLPEPKRYPQRERKPPDRLSHKY